MRPTFGREYIENEFQRIADRLTDPLTIYLIGGGAMSPDCVRLLEGPVPLCRFAISRARRRISTSSSLMVTRTASCGLS